MKKTNKLLIIFSTLIFVFMMIKSNIFISYAYPVSNATVNASIEPYATTSILDSFLEQLNFSDTSILSILNLKIGNINPTVNKNNNSYTYTLDENTDLIVECKKDDTQKIITDIRIKAATQSGTVVLTFLNGTNNQTMDITINYNVIYRVIDDNFFVKAGSDLLIKNNDYLPTQGKSSIILCDETGKALSKTGGIYTPSTGLNLSVGGNSITVNDTSVDGEYTFYYYIDNNKSGKVYNDNENNPAMVTLTVDQYADYKLTDDLIIAQAYTDVSYNLIENDKLPEEIYSIKLYSNSSYTTEISQGSSLGTISTNEYYYDKIRIDNKTGLLTFKMGNRYINLYYRVYFTSTKYIDGKVTIASLYTKDLNYEIEVGESGSNKPSYYIYEDIKYTLCKKNGGAYEPIDGITVSFDDNRIEYSTSEVGEYTLYYKAVYGDLSSTISKITIISKENLSETGFYTKEDKVDAIIGTDTEPIDFLANDVLPKIEEVEGATKTEIVLISDRRYYDSELKKYVYKEFKMEDADENGYLYPDMDEEENPGQFSVRAKIVDNKIIAGLFKQGKGGINYRIKYLNDEGKEIEIYDGSITLIPVLTIPSTEIKTKDEFKITDLKDISVEIDKENSWQIVEGNYIENPNKTIIAANGDIKLNKNAIPTKEINKFYISLDFQSRLSWEEVLSTNTCRLQNGNSDNSSKRILLYNTYEEAKKIVEVLKEANYADKKTEIVEVYVKYYHDDWKDENNILHTFKRYVIKDSGNFSLFCQGPPDQGLHGDKDQQRKIAANNVYYVDITETYNNYNFASKTIVPNSVIDKIDPLLKFNDFVYNDLSAAIYDSNNHQINWDLTNLFKGIEDEVIEYEEDGKKTYYHQYNLTYSLYLNTNNKDFTSNKIYPTSSYTKLMYNDEEETFFPECAVKGIITNNPETSVGITLTIIIFVLSIIGIKYFTNKKKKEEDF